MFLISKYPLLQSAKILPNNYHLDNCQISPVRDDFFHVGFSKNNVRNIISEQPGQAIVQNNTNRYYLKGKYRIWDCGRCKFLVPDELYSGERHNTLFVEKSLKDDHGIFQRSF